jgi:phosphatidylserine/phosphatidylglycerophosphate/cardiolipin synthase-like enzyme
LLLLTVLPARAADRLCDPGAEDCRAILINLIRNEKVRIDVAFWFMEDARYSNELERKRSEGVPVRVLMDTRANADYNNEPQVAQLAAAGIPMRRKVTSYILHWKMMLFHGQNTVQFSGANYSPDAFRPGSSTPYLNYVDEVIYFTDQGSLVNSFRRKFEDHWTDNTNFADYANMSSAVRGRVYDLYSLDPQLQFSPETSYRSRSIANYKAENEAIDVIMFRITDRQHTDTIIARKQAGVRVRLITEQDQYRDPSRLWHSWNVDRLYMAGIEVKHRGHAGLNHQKTVLLHGIGAAIFGSSNWTSPSNNDQIEHNMFTKQPHIYNWLVDQFERKWNNTGGVTETIDFVPLPPDTANKPSPAHLATGVNTTVTLRWFGGPWAHLYDVYFGTSSNPPLIASNVELGPSESSSETQSFKVPTTLTAGTTYYWKIVSKTMAQRTRTSPIWSFTTAGSGPPPPPPPDGDGSDIVLYASNATVRAGAWVVQSDSSAAGGSKIRHPNAGAAKLSSALSNPTNYFELTFTAEAGTPYRLWMRGRADNNYWGSDSVFVQFSNSVTSSGNSTWRIGTTSATEWNLEDCSGCGLSGWGWQDNGWGVGVMGPLVRFGSSGTQRIRIQTREDGISIDQVVLSPATYLNTSPGNLKNDNTRLAESDGSGSGSGSGSDPEAAADDVLLYASDVTALGGAWRLESDSSAAGGKKLRHPNQGASKLTTALASPVNFARFSFDAESDRGYRIWVRARADNDHWSNDSVFLQFSGSVTSSGSPRWRTGTTSAAEMNLEDCSGCRLSGWGWQDNGWGVGVLGPLVYFANNGPQTMLVQTREDGLSIDQIILSPDQFLEQAPGALKNDDTIVAKDEE